MLVLLLLLSMFLQVDARVSPSRIYQPNSIWEDLEERAEADEEGQFSSEEEEDDIEEGPLYEEQAPRTPVARHLNPPASPYVSPRVFGQNIPANLSPLAPNENVDIERLIDATRYVLGTPPQGVQNVEPRGNGHPGLNQAAGRRLIPGSPLRQEVGQNPQRINISPTNAGQPRTAEQAGLARRTQGRNVRRRLDLDTPVHQLQYHRDDENGPDGGGVPVN